MGLVEPKGFYDGIDHLARAYPKPAGFVPSYGTAGFRSEASLLKSTVLRCGLLMGLRAKKLQSSTGLVITASHNPAEDNGVKLVDPSGYMLAQDWEVYADKLAQCESPDDLVAAVKEIVALESISVGGGPGGVLEGVLLAHDTRPSAGDLLEVAKIGIAAAGVTPRLLGLLTTPQLHWMVRQANRGLPAAEPDYFAALSRGFAHLVSGSPPSLPEAEGSCLSVDCAFGVGGPKLKLLQEAVGSSRLALQTVNVEGGQLNEGCGSDFVEKQRQAPHGFAAIPPARRCASIDGDADRLVYFRAREGGGLLLFDGDRIAILTALLIKDLLSRMPPSAPTVHMGVVQTAYANGASTSYLQNVLGCTVVTACTGVKHLHHEAAKLAIGIYFEANGHGTVLFAPELLARLSKEEEEGEQQRQGGGPAADLLAMAGMVNQAVGDALSNILLVEACLFRKGWGLEEWAGLYQDLPSRQLKVKVKDRRAITTADAERRVVSPPGLQEAIEGAVAGVSAGRSFVRPSGTEDVVRVYAEARTQDAADALAVEVARAVYRIAGGCGDPP
eukprot:jgi/Botrbrau1/13014/Bobra.0389s0011.1